jgi:hypothetical protein
MFTVTIQDMAKAKEYNTTVTLSTYKLLNVSQRNVGKKSVTIFSSSKSAGNLQFKAIRLLPHSVFVSARGVERNWNLEEDQKSGLIKHPNC